MDSSPLDAVPEASKEIPVEKASHSVGLSSGIIFIIATVIQGIGLISTYALAQSVGWSDAGKVTLGLVQFYLFVSSSINNIGDLRIGAAYTFFVSRGKPASESTGTYLILRVGMVLAGAVMLWLISPILTYTGPNGTPIPITANTTELLALGIFLVLPLLWSISTVFTQMTVALGKSIRGQYPLLIESIIRTSCLVYVAQILPHPASVTAAYPSSEMDTAILLLTLAYVPGAIASSLFSLRLVLRNYSPFSRKETSTMFRFAWPLMGSLMLTWIASNAVALYIVAVGGTLPYNEFNAANGFRILALGVPTAVIVPLFPSLTSLHARNLIGRLRLQTFEALRYTAMAVVPAALCLAIYRVDFLATLVQPSYAVAATPLAILAISAIPAGLAMVIGTALNSVRLQRLELYLTSTQVVVLFVASATLGPPIALLAPYGVNVLMAASLAILASSISALAVNSYFMERHLRVRIALRPVVSIVVAAGIAFYVISRINLIISVHRFYALFGAVILGFTVYAFALSFLGELTQADVRRVGGMVGLPVSVTGPLSRLCWRKTSNFPEPTGPLEDDPPMPPGPREPPSGGPLA